MSRNIYLNIILVFLCLYTFLIGIKGLSSAINKISSPENIFPADQVQLNLFYSQNGEEKRKDLYKSVDFINQTMGRNKIQILGQGMANKWKLKQENLSPCYTTRWTDLLRVHC